MIPEDSNDEEPAQDIKNINQQIEQREKRKSLALIGKASSSKQGLSLFTQSRKGSVKKKPFFREQTVMDLVNNQADRETVMDDMSCFIMPEEEQNFEPSDQKYIKQDDPAVQIGLDRLARL